jgi:hypothetical protein
MRFIDCEKPVPSNAKAVPRATSDETEQLQGKLIWVNERSKFGCYTRIYNVGRTSAVQGLENVAHVYIHHTSQC